eukprot:SAG31_NODE_1359_length_8639_cov_3.889813_9_plen_117_part_00
MVVAVVPVRTQLRAFLYTAVFCTAPLAAPADPIEYVDTAKLSERELLVAAVRAGAQLPTAALEQKLTGAASPQVARASVHNWGRVMLLRVDLLARTRARLQSAWRDRSSCTLTCNR